MLTRSFANTVPKRFVMFLSSSIPLLLLHRVRYPDFPGDDLLPGGFDDVNGRLRNEVFVVLVESKSDAFVFQTVNVHSTDRSILHTALHDLIHRVVNPLDHARENKTRLYPVLVGVDTYNEPPRPSLTVFPVLFDSIECAEARIAGCSEDHISTLFDLSSRQFLAFDGIVPGCIGHADVIGDDPNHWIDSLRAFFVPHLEFVNQRSVHASDEADRSRF